MIRRLLFLISIFSGAITAQAQESFLDAEAGVTHENLTNGRDAWKSVYLEAARQFAPRQTLYGTVRETERFGFKDSEVMLGYSQPFGANLTALVEGSYSSQHNVLAENSLYGQLAWAFGSGWVTSGGARHSEYTTSGVNMLVGNLERYWSSFRAGYTVYNGRPEGSGSATAQRLSLDHYYDGEKSRIGVSIAWGREVENQGPPTGIITSDIRDLTVTGRHWLNNSWAVSWDAWRHEQGDLYTRTGGRLGLRYRF
jgi:YaiO family outer membrane protein